MVKRLYLFRYHPDLLTFVGSFLDVATLGELTRLTGTGAIFKYFNDFSDSFLTDLRYSLYSSFAFDCVIKGVCFASFYSKVIGIFEIFQSEHQLESELMIILVISTLDHQMISNVPR